MRGAEGDSIGFGGDDGGRGRRRPSGWGGWVLVLSAVGGFAACYDATTREGPRFRENVEAAPEAQVGRERYGVAVWGLAYSPDGARLAVATIDGGLSLKDVATGQTTALRSGESGSTRVLTFSPDGRELAAAGQSTTVRVWDVATAREREPLRIPGKRVDGLAFSPDGNRLAVGLWDGTLSDWDWRRGRPCGGQTRSVPGLLRLATAPDGTTFAAGDARGRVIVFGPAGVLWAAAPGHSTAITSVAFSPDGTALAAASLYDPEARVYDAAGGALRYSVGKGHLGVTSVAFSPDGTLLATADLDGKARLYDVKEGRERGSVSAGRALYALAFSPDGATFATGDHGGWVRYWSLGRSLSSR